MVMSVSGDHSSLKDVKGAIELFFKDVLPLATQEKRFPDFGSKNKRDSACDAQGAWSRFYLYKKDQYYSCDRISSRRKKAKKTCKKKK